MRLTAENKEKIRLRILRGAAALFRERGYDGVTLDQVMNAANLTRGAFYAHFRSKDDLFAQVVRHERPLLRMLRKRSGSGADALWRQLLGIFEGYLRPENLAAVYRGCTVASLTGDTARSSDAVKKAYQAAWTDIVDEMARGQPVADPEMLRAALTLAGGAVNTAASCADAATQKDILDAAWQGVSRLLNDARARA